MCAIVVGVESLETVSYELTPYLALKMAVIVKSPDVGHINSECHPIKCQCQCDLAKVPILNSNVRRTEMLLLLFTVPFCLSCQRVSLSWKFALYSPTKLIGIYLLQSFVLYFFSYFEIVFFLISFEKKSFIFFFFFIGFIYWDFLNRYFYFIYLFVYLFIYCKMN